MGDSFRQSEDRGWFEVVEQVGITRHCKTSGKSCASTFQTILWRHRLYSQDSPEDIVGTVRDIAPIMLEAVTSKEAKQLWNEYVARYHYLGYKKPFGFRLRYFIACGHGLLGCVLFSGAAKSIGSRDRWIGWIEQQRLRNLAWVINNSRLLIFPWVRLLNLASHVLGQISRRIASDWNDLWGYRPILLETFVDPIHYEGVCYKAANWRYVGMTTGEGLVRNDKTYVTSPKKVFVYPLQRDFRAALCSAQLVGRVEL